jgi:probable F420-dependent oxidoreductase
MELPKFGVLGFFDTLQGKDVGPFARSVEQLGYDALWVPEIMGREIFSLSSYVLSQTDRLTIGTGVAIAYTYEPIAAMGAARTLNELFDGRFILGLGVSNKTYNARRGINYERPVAFMRDYIAKMKAAPYNAPKPQQEPPIVLAAMMPKMLQLAAQATRGTLTYFTTTEQVAGYRKALGPQPWLGAVQLVMLETDAGKARAAARRYMQIYMAIGHYLHRLRALGFHEADFTDGGSDRLVDAIVAWGSEEQLRARIDAQYRAGANHVCIVPLRSDGRAGADDAALRALAPHH